LAVLDSVNINRVAAAADYLCSRLLLYNIITLLHLVGCADAAVPRDRPIGTVVRQVLIRRIGDAVHNSHLVFATTYEAFLVVAKTDDRHVLLAEMVRASKGRIQISS
jgi:hypothetical protein